MLGWMFVVLDFLVIVALITIAVASEHFTLLGTMGEFYAGNSGLRDGDPVYDPYVWVGLMPVEGITLVTNVWLALWKRTKTPSHMPRLMKIVYLYLFSIARRRRNTPMLNLMSNMLSI